MKITMHCFWQQYDWEDNGSLFVVNGDDNTRKVYERVDRTFISSVEVDMPDIDAPSRDQIASAKVAALKTERQAIMAESQMKLNEIDDKIKQLSCITYVAE